MDREPGVDPSESDDCDGPSTVEYGGSRWRKLREDPRHEAFNMTGLNISQVLSVIYEVSHGISYHDSKHLVKCGVNGATQVRNSFETLLKLGHYDDITKYVRPDALVTESLPTADSGGRYQHSYEPDGSMKAMHLHGWFDKGGVGEKWKAALMPSVNIDTGLTEPFHLPVFKHTASGIPTFKHAFKRKARFSNKKKCMVCYKSMRLAFEQQDAYANGEDWEVDSTEELEARQLPPKMVLIGVGYGAENDGNAPFSVPLWVKFFTLKFKGVADMYRMIHDVIPSANERLEFWMGVTALLHEFVLVSVFGEPRLMFHVYSFRDFVYSVQAGRFNDLVLLARYSQDKDARVFNNETIRVRLNNLLSLGAQRDNGGVEITYNDYIARRHVMYERFRFTGPGPSPVVGRRPSRVSEWIYVFRAVEMNVRSVRLMLNTLLGSESLKMRFMGCLHDFLSFASEQRNVAWVYSSMSMQLHDPSHELPVNSLSDFVQAVTADNFIGVLSALHTYGQIMVRFDGSGPPDINVIYSNINKVLVQLGTDVASKDGFIIPKWIEEFNVRDKETFAYDALVRLGDVETLKTNIGHLIGVVESMKSRKDLKKIIVPSIDTFRQFTDAVDDQRYEDLACQILNCCMYFSFFNLRIIVGNLGRLKDVIEMHQSPPEINRRPTPIPMVELTIAEVPHWIMTFSLFVNVEMMCTVMTAFIKPESPNQFKDNLAKLRDSVLAAQSRSTLPILDRVAAPFIDSFTDFVGAVMHLRFEDLVSQLIISSRTFSFFNVSFIIENFNRLIKKIRKMQPRKTGDDTGGTRKERDQKDTGSMAPTAVDASDTVVSTIWVSAFNEYWDDSYFFKDGSVLSEISILDTQKRLNFIRNLGNFILRLEKIKYDPNYSFEVYRNVRAPAKDINYFVNEIANGIFLILTAHVLQCVQPLDTQRGNSEALQLCHSFDWGLIITNLKDLRLRISEMNNCVFYINLVFVTPQWVHDFTNPVHSDSDEVLAMFKSLLSYISGVIDFSVSDFLKSLDAMARELTMYEFSGILIKSPIVTLPCVFNSICHGGASASKEIFATVYYDPARLNSGGDRFNRFKTRFQAFSVYCSEHLVAKMQDDAKAVTEENAPSTINDTPEWIESIMSADGGVKMIAVLDSAYGLYGDSFIVWKSLSYLAAALYNGFLPNGGAETTPITTMEVFVQALYDKRFDDLLRCIHQYAPNRINTIESVLESMIVEIKEDAQIHHGAQYGLYFREWVDDRKKEMKIKESEYAKEHGILLHHDSDDPAELRAAELNDWLNYRPIEFEDLISDDKDSVGGFEWVFSLVGYSSEELADFTWTVRDLTTTQKIGFFTLLPKFIKHLEAIKIYDDHEPSSTHAKIYTWKEFILALLEPTSRFHQLSKIMLMCNKKRLGRIRFFFSSGVMKLTGMYNCGRERMKSMTPAKSAYENALVLSNQNGGVLVTHSYPKFAMIVESGDSETMTEFVVKKPARKAKDSLFECIKDSMKTLLASGAQPYLLYFHPFSTEFLQEVEWCDNQRKKIVRSLFLSEREVEVDSAGTGVKSLRKVKDLVKEAYFAGKDKQYIDKIMNSFVNSSKISEAVGVELMQAISDMYNLTIYVTSSELVRKLRKAAKPDFEAVEYSYPSQSQAVLLPSMSTTRIAAPVTREGGSESVPEWVVLFSDDLHAVLVYKQLTAFVSLPDIYSFKTYLSKLCDAITGSNSINQPHVISQPISTFEDFVAAVKTGRTDNLVAHILKFQLHGIGTIVKNLHLLINEIELQNPPSPPSPAPDTGASDDTSEDLAYSRMYTPSVDRLPWEDPTLFAKRRRAFKVSVYLRYCQNESVQNEKAEDFAQGWETTHVLYTGYQTLIDAQMTEVFAMEKIDNIMQRNVIDMLLKFQKQCQFAWAGPQRAYRSPAYSIRSFVTMRREPFTPRLDFFSFNIQEDFILNLAVSSAGSEVERGWDFFSDLINDLWRGFVPHLGTVEVNLQEGRENLKCYEFDSIRCLAKDSKRGYTVKGEYNYETTEKKWKDYLYCLYNEMQGGAIFDSVQLTAKDNRNIPLFATDVVFESVHLTEKLKDDKRKDEVRNEAKYYLLCVWVSLLSFMFHPVVERVHDLKLSDAQYYFVSATMGRLSGVESFFLFVSELCQKKEAELNIELTTRQWDDEKKRKIRIEYQRSCRETITLLEDPSKHHGNTIEFGAAHKSVIATILNLHIIECELDKSMKLSPDRAHFVVRPIIDFVGRDSYFINPNVFPVPDLFKDPVRFMIRNDFTPVSTNNKPITVQIDEIEMLQDFNWTCGNELSFFGCIAETCFVIKTNQTTQDGNGGGNIREFMYANDEGGADASHAHRDFVHVLNRIFEWYRKGFELEKKYSQDGSTQHPLAKISDSYFKIKSIITYIIAFHWDGIANLILRQALATLPVFDGIVTVVIWEAFMQFMSRDEYIPGMFEMQVLADYLGINICVFKHTGFTTMQVKNGVSDGKIVPYVFMPLVESQHVLAIAETVEDSFMIMTPRHAEKDSTFSQPFIISNVAKERFKRVTCMRPVENLDKSQECDILLNTKTRFYDALADYIKADDIPVLNIYRRTRGVSHASWFRLVDVYIYVVAQTFSEFFSGEGDDGDGIGVHEFLDEIKIQMKEDYAEGSSWLKDDVISQLKRNNNVIIQMFAASIHGQEDKIRIELDTIDLNPTFQANYHSIMAHDDFEGSTESKNVTLPINKSNTFKIITDRMKNWLNNVHADIKRKILYHHYSVVIKTEVSRRKKGKDTTPITEFEKQLWSNYIGSEFLEKLPSEYEFEMIAVHLKVRLMVFSDAWSRSIKRMLKYKGTQELLYDTGLNSSAPLVFTIDARSAFSIMSFHDSIDLRNERSVDSGSVMKFDTLVNDCFKRHKSDVTKLANGTFTTMPRLPALYQFLGLNPLASKKDIMSSVAGSTSKYKRPLVQFAEDKNASNLGNFKPLLGEFGPQSYEDVQNIRKFFKEYAGIDKFIYFLPLAWQIISNDQYRYIYHVREVILPMSRRIDNFKPDFDQYKNPDPSVGENFEKWSFKNDGEDTRTALEANNYYQNFIKRLPVFIQVKGRTPNVESLGMKSTSEAQWAHGGVLSSELRDVSINQFKSRFNVKRSLGVGDDDQLSSDIYAVMLPTQKSFSHIKCNSNEYKAYMTLNAENPDLGIHMSRVSIVSIVLEGEIPDMRTQTPSNTLDFEVHRKWSNDWCGLKMCIQTAFFFARHDTTFKKLIMTHIGDSNDLFRFEWLETFMCPEQNDDFSLYARKGANNEFNTKDTSVFKSKGGSDGNGWMGSSWLQAGGAMNESEESINFKGITNPYHVNYKTLREMIIMLNKTNERALGEGEHSKHITSLLKNGENWLTTPGKWDTDDSISNFFDAIDMDAERGLIDVDRRKEKMEKSMVLMRLLGMAFNVEFVILDCFRDNDVNSLKLSDDKFHYYSVSEDGAEKKICNLDHTFIKSRGLFWSNVPVLSENIYKQKLLSLKGVESSPVKAYPLPVFVIWDKDKWNILRWSALHNTSISEEIQLKKYKIREAARLKVVQAKQKDFGADWRGKMFPNPNMPGDNSNGLGHFSADECDEADDDDDNDSYYSSSDHEDPSDEDSWDGSDEEDSRGAARFDKYMSRKGVTEPKALWGKGVPRSAPRSEKSQPSGPRNRGWETKSLFSLTGRKPRPNRVSKLELHEGVKTSHHSFNEDQKEIHFLSQKVPMAVNVLRYLNPYGCCDLKLQMGQMEQTKILAVIFACCFDSAMIVPIKGCFTTRMMVACKGLRKDIVALAGVRQMLKRCFDLKESSFQSALSQLYRMNLISAKRVDDLMKQVQSASDELWADDFRCSLILARSYIQATLDGKVSPAPEYLSPELAELMNRRVFSKVTPEQRGMNQEMIRTLMKSNIADQLLPLFRVVFHPDLHTWRLTLPENYKRVVHDPMSKDPKYWQWDAAAAAAAAEFSTQQASGHRRIGI